MTDISNLLSKSKNSMLALSYLLDKKGNSYDKLLSISTTDDATAISTELPETDIK